MRRLWTVLLPLERFCAATSVLAFVSMTLPPVAFAQSVDELHRTLPVTLAAPVALDVDLPRGELQILYSRDGQVSINALAQAPAGTRLDKGFLESVLSIEQDGNRIRIRHASAASYPEDAIKVLYRIDVPYRTEVVSTLGDGKVFISGILGPVKAITHRGDIKASYVSNGVVAETQTGNLDFEVIGERVEARTSSGNISCTRAAQGISAETNEGDITLMVVGPSTAIVKNGAGTIDVGGARGSLVASTDAGELRLKANPHGDWRLNSAAGAIRAQLPPTAQFEVDATTNSGEIVVKRGDIALSDDARHLHQKTNGGGRQIQIHTDRGKIVIE